jgi:hypothetical protein
MSDDVSQLSDADLLAQFQAAQQAQSAAAMSHTGTGGYDPANSAWMKEFGPTSGMSTPELLAAGVGRGMVHTGRAAANLVGAIPDSVLKDEKVTDAPLMGTTPGQIGNLVGETAVTAPLGAGVGAGLGKLGTIGASLAANPAVNAGLQGATQGLVTSDPGDRLTNTVTGGVTGTTLGAGSAIAKRLAQGLTRTPAAQTLIDQGISLTPGQLNPNGVMNQFEQAAESIPGAKQIIEPAREAAERQYQATIIGKGAAPGAPPIKPSENISDMLQQAYDSYKPLYDQANGFPVSPKIMNTTGPDVPLSSAFQTAAKAPGVPKSLQASENEWLQDRLTQLPQNPQSEDLLQLRSDIRQRARTANLKSDTDSGHVANINGRADQAVTQALNSQLPPEPLAALQSADSNYGNYKIIENAVAKSKDNLAGLTPQKLSQAIYDAVPDAAYARGGGGPLRDLAQAGTEVFQNVSPPTGARVVTLGAGGLAALHPAVGIPAATGALGLTGTRVGRSLAAGTTAPQQAAQRLTAALQKNVPAPIRNAAGQVALSGGTLAGTPVTQAALPQALAAALMLAPPASNASH